MTPASQKQTPVTEDGNERAMRNRSKLGIPAGFYLKHATKALLQNWRTVYALARFQMAKETFGLRHPGGATHGHGDRPQLIGLRITDLCNLRCHSCGQWGDNGYLRDTSSEELKNREVPVESFKKVVDDIVAAGWSPIWYIWGGEPMLYPDLSELLYYIKERGMTISLVTNGTHVAQRAEVLLDTCDILHVSVDGPTADIHDAQRPGVSRTSSNFRTVVEGMQAIQDGKRKRRQVFPYLVPLSCVTSYNIDYLADLYKFNSRFADAHVLYLTWWIDQASARAHSEDFKRRFDSSPSTHFGWIGDWMDFDHSVIFDKLEEITALSRELGTCPPIFIPKLENVEENERYFTDHSATFGYDQCVSIYMTLELDCNGRVSLCRDYHDYSVGNIKEDSIVDLWNNERAIRFRKSLSRDGLMPACRRCCGLMGF